MPEKITPGQVMSLRSALRDLKGMTEAAHPFIVSKLIQRDIDSLHDLTRREWQELRNWLYPNWKNEDWTIGEDSRLRLATLLEQYRETITGQKRLFEGD